MNDYETEVQVFLSTNNEVNSNYDQTRWKITDRKIDWIGGNGEQDLESHIKKLVEDVFSNSNAEISGKIYWQGEDDEDTGTILVQGSDVQTVFGKIIYNCPQ